MKHIFVALGNVLAPRHWNAKEVNFAVYPVGWGDIAQI